MKERGLRELSEDEIKEIYQSAKSSHELVAEYNIRMRDQGLIKRAAHVWLRKILDGVERDIIIDPKLIEKFPPLVNSSNRGAKRINSFLNKITQCEDSECWISNAKAFNNAGYPMFCGLEPQERPDNGDQHATKGRPVVSGVGRMMLSSRYAFELFNGVIEENQVMRHSEYCGSAEGKGRACINPAHLVAGTQLQNMKEAWENNSWGDRIRISDEDFVEIYTDADTPAHVFAEKLGVSEGAIYSARRGQHRQHLVGHLKRPKNRKIKSYNSKVTWEIVDAVLADLAAGMKCTDAAIKYGFHVATISHIRHNKTPLQERGR